MQGWNAARLLAQMEAGQGQVDDELLSRYRTQYDNFDAMFQAVRDGTAPAQDIAAQKAVTRWMDRLTYQMNYDEFLSSISSQADVIRRNPLFSDPHTFSPISDAIVPIRSSNDSAMHIPSVFWYFSNVFLQLPPFSVSYKHLTQPTNSLV